jgi:hypothetical protein
MRRRRKKPIAIACHGFVSIPAKREKEFAERFNIVDWNRPDAEVSKPPALQQPLRALVKDLVESDPEMTDSLLKSMIRELKALNSMKIYVKDISVQNYKGGHLVDFSSSWTEPHFMFQKNIRSPREIARFRKEDLYTFDEMIEDLGIQTSVRAAPMKNSETAKKLRKALAQAQHGLQK